MAAKKRRVSGDVPYFYSPDIITTKRLSTEEATHAFRVLRMELGDEVRVLDGAGRLYGGRLASKNVESALLSEVTLLESTPPVAAPLHLAIAPTKHIDRIEWLLEKLTELGADRVSLVVTERAVRRKVNMERLERIVICALKQSQRLSLPVLELFSSLEDFLTSSHLEEQRYIGYCGLEYERKVLTECFTTKQGSTFLIGPEGDFTPEEVAGAVATGFAPVVLTEQRLRTETAGLYVAMMHLLRNE